MKTLPHDRRGILATGALWLIGLLLLGCGAPQGAGSPSPGEEAARAPLKVGAVIRGDVPTLFPGAMGAVPGGGDIIQLMNVGLSAASPLDPPLVPRIAEAVPTTENGLWKVLPDGRMETTWKLRRDVVWHDGTPLTVQDLLFSARLERDPLLPIGLGAAGQFVDTIEAPDDFTYVVKWKSPYLKADAGVSNTPYPRHLLEPAYLSGDLDRFQALPHWTTEYVGTGPFKLRQWNVGSGAILEPNDRFFLGRPKVDLLEVKFIPDPNTIAASILAGDVDVTFGGRLALDWAQELEGQAQGKVILQAVYANSLDLYPNLFNPTPQSLMEVDFRRALVHAMDRQSMMEALVGGLTAVTHAIVLNPSVPNEYAAAESSIVRYDYDPRKSVQLLEAAGFRKGSDGFYRDRAGQPMGLEIRTTQGDIQQERATHSTADYWQQVGVKTDVSITPAAQRNNFPYRTTYPGLDLRRQGGDPYKFHSSQAPFESNHYNGNNHGRYQNADYDRLAEAYVKTIPFQERMELLNQVTYWITSQVITIGTFYDVAPNVTTSRMRNVVGGSGGGQSWNAHQWDVG